MSPGVGGGGIGGGSGSGGGGSSSATFGSPHSNNFIIEAFEDTFVQTSTATFFSSVVNINGAVSSITYPDVDASKPHLQALSRATDSVEIVSNSDPLFSILVKFIDVIGSHSDSAPLPPYIGTLSVSGSDLDIVRYSVGAIGHDFRFETNLLLPPGTSLVHNQVNGPGVGGKGEDKYFTVIVGYILVPAVSPASVS